MIDENSKRVLTSGQRGDSRFNSGENPGALPDCGTDRRRGRDVALKVLPQGALGDEAARKRFRKEALTLSRLNHPNVATVHDFDTQEWIDFLVTELISGTTLAEKLRDRKLPEKEILALGIQMAAALEEAHEHGTVHRDFKSGNVMVTAKGQAKVLDLIA